MSPSELITSFRIMAWKFFPYLSSYVYALQPIERPGIGTMAIDRDGRLYYDPNFCEELTNEKGAYVVLHEAFHLILRHCHRIEEMLGKNASAQDKFDMNIAADLVVWQAMEGVKQHMPEGGVNLPDALRKYPGIKSNQTLEEYYDVIKSHRIKPPKQPEKQPGEQKPEDNPCRGDGPSMEQEPSDEGQDGEQQGKTDKKSDGKGEDKDDCKGNPQPTEKDDQGEPLQDDGWKPVGGGSAADGHRREYEEKPDPDWSAFQEDELLQGVEKKIQEYEQSPVKDAVAGRHVPGCLKVAIGQKLRPTPDPWKQLGAAVGRAASTPVGSPDSTYRKMSRRQSAVPGTRLKGVHRLCPKAVVVLDTSGSMCWGETQAKALNVIAQGLRTVGQVPVVAGDTAARSSKTVTHLKQVTWDGGGGTDMTKVLKAADKKYSPDVIVLVTDGYTPWPDKKTRYRLVVACTTEAQTPTWAVTCRIPNEVK